MEPFYKKEHRKVITQVTDFQNNVRRFVLFDPDTHKPIFDKLILCDREDWGEFLEHFDLLMDCKEDFSYAEIASQTAWYFEKKELYADQDSVKSTPLLCPCKKRKKAKSKEIPDQNSIDDTIPTISEEDAEKNLKTFEESINEIGKKWVSVAEAAERLKCKQKTLETYRREGSKSRDGKCGKDKRGNIWRYNPETRKSEYLLECAPQPGANPDDCPQGCPLPDLHSSPQSGVNPD